MEGWGPENTVKAPRGEGGTMLLNGYKKPQILFLWFFDLFLWSGICLIRPSLFYVAILAVDKEFAIVIFRNFYGFGYSCFLSSEGPGM